MKQALKAVFILCVVYGIAGTGCANAPKPVEKLTKPVDKTAEEIVRVRELKSEGKTRAVLSPADERQLRIPF